MIKIKDIYKSYGSREILSGISFSLEKGQRIAFIGQNGIGKSTLLKILAGVEEADSGSVEIMKGACIGYLPQDTSVVENKTIKEYLKKVTGIDMLEKEMAELESQVDNLVKQKRYTEVEEMYEKLDGYNFSHQVDVMLSGFGLNTVNIDKPLSNLSSGQKNKVALIGILLKGVDILLLDEPTNNLDLPALIWLEDFILKSKTATIIVSHDRRFLDKIANKVMELDWRSHALVITGGTYSDYLERRVKEHNRQKQTYLLQQKEIERLTEQARLKKIQAAQGARFQGSDNDKFLRGFKRDRAAKSSRTAKVLEKRIEQMEKVEKPIERDALKIPLTADEKHGALNIELHDIIAGYSDGFKIGPISFTINFGNRVGIMGLNGSGKSTLLKVITGHLKPLAGQIIIGSGVVIGDMMQEHETLPREQTLSEFLTEKVSLREQDIYAVLTKFGFDSGQIKDRIKMLSPGGRARLLLALFSLQSVNTLILDEPTNHLDIEALEALEDMLETYAGSVLIVSHDRYFLEKIKPDPIYLLADGMLKKISSYQEYIKTAEQKAKKMLRLL